MNKYSLPIVLLLLLCSLFLTSPGSIAADGEMPEIEADRADPSTWTWNDPTPHDGFIHDEIYSPSMKRKMGYNIYLPPSYNREPDKRYPVVFWLHGGGGYENDIGMAEVAKAEIDSGNLGEVIWVVSNNGHFAGYFDWPDESKHIMAETWVIKELIPSIDQRYRTLGTKQGRALAGYSMGSAGTFRLGFKYPELFSALVGCSGPGTGPDGMIQKFLGLEFDDGVRDDAYYWMEQHQDQLKDGAMPIMLTMGDSEFHFHLLPPFLEKLNSLDIQFRVSIHAGLDHHLGKTTGLSGMEIVHFLADHYQPAKVVKPGPQRNDPSTWRWNDSTPIYGFTHGEIFSESMKRKIGYNIYLPPSYDNEPDKRYPVVFWLHGSHGSENDVGMAEVAMAEIEAGKMGEVIWVVSNNGHFSGYRDWADQNVEAETWVIKELIPTIDRRYRTFGTKAGRAVAGYSMGSAGSFRLAFKYPELFCAIVGCSGPAHGPSEEIVAGNVRDDAFYWAEQHVDQLRDGNMPIMMTMGDSEFLFDRFPPFITKLNELGIQFQVTIHENLEHHLGKTIGLSGKDIVHFLDEQFKSAFIEE